LDSTISFPKHVINVLVNKNTSRQDTSPVMSTSLNYALDGDRLPVSRSGHSTPGKRHFTKLQDKRLNWVQESVGIWWQNI